MCSKRSLWWKLIALAVALVLIVPILAACGDGEETPTSTITVAPTAAPTTNPAITATPIITTTATVGPTATPVKSAPVKIGMINSWSGPAAMAGLGLADPIIALVEKQVKDEGGILGGREVQVVRYDNRASVAEAIAGVKKLYYDDKVSVITVGGTSGGEFNAVAPACEEVGILYISMANVEDLAKYKFTVTATVQSE